MTDQEPIIDPVKWQRLVESLQESVVDVVESFLEDTPEKIEEMKAAFAQGDMDTVGRLAHSMKSSSAIFGARGFSQMSLRLEQAVQQNEGGLAEKVEELSKSYWLVEEQLKRNLDQAGYTLT